MLKKKGLLNILAVFIATALLFLTVDIGFIIADETSAHQNERYTSHW